jgi:hypothetical protein
MCKIKKEQYMETIFGLTEKELGYLGDIQLESFCSLCNNEDKENFGNLGET